MPDITPVDLFPGYLQKDSDGSGAISGAAASQSYILIPIDTGGDLSTLTALEAAADGDGRKVAWEIIRQIHAAIDAMEAAAKPEKFTVSTGSPTLVSETLMRRTYTQMVDLTVPAVDVADETTTTTTGA